MNFGDPLFASLAIIIGGAVAIVLAILIDRERRHWKFDKYLDAMLARPKKHVSAVLGGALAKSGAHIDTERDNVSALTKPKQAAGK